MVTTFSRDGHACSRGGAYTVFWLSGQMEIATVAAAALNSCIAAALIKFLPSILLLFCR